MKKEWSDKRKQKERKISAINHTNLTKSNDNHNNKKQKLTGTSFKPVSLTMNEGKKRPGYNYIYCLYMREYKV